MLADLLTKRAVIEPNGGIGGAFDDLWPSRPRHGFVERLWPYRSQNDFARATAICIRLSLRGELGPQVMKRMPELNHLARVAQGLGPGTRPIGWMYRHAFAAQARVSPGSAVDVASQWARWAAMRGDAGPAAEAHWSWITAVVAASRRRAFHEGKTQQLFRIQGRITEACAWLLKAQRTCDAAVALELGRAVLLTERMQREHPGLDQRLAEAGRDDLLRRWVQAREHIQAADRAAFAPDAESAGRRPSDVRAGGFASAEFLALAAHEQVLREIGELPGFDDLVAAVDYDDLRAAACDGPVVYICAAADAGNPDGFALIVTEQPAPEVVTLPGLTTRASDERAKRLAGLESEHDIVYEIEQMRPWLWETLMGPIVQRLAAGSLVTLIPTGALGQLPLCVACTAPDDEQVWHDVTPGLAFRFAPNARVLRRAQATARGFANERRRCHGLGRNRRASHRCSEPSESTTRPRPPSHTSSTRWIPARSGISRATASTTPTSRSRAASCSTTARSRCGRSSAGLPDCAGSRC